MSYKGYDNKLGWCDFLCIMIINKLINQFIFIDIYLFIYDIYLFIYV